MSGGGAGPGEFVNCAIIYSKLAVSGIKTGTGTGTMEIKTYEDLIDWTRQLHASLGRCLHEGADKSNDDRLHGLLDYLAKHEDELTRIVREFERQADPKAMKTRLYDYLNFEHQPLESHRTCDTHYEDLDFDGICREIFDYHDQVISLYDGLLGKAEVPEVIELLESLKAMEEHEAMRLASQVASSRDV